MPARTWVEYACDAHACKMASPELGSVALYFVPVAWQENTADARTEVRHEELFLCDQDARLILQWCLAKLSNEDGRRLAEVIKEPNWMANILRETRMGAA